MDRKLTVNGALARTNALFTPGHSLEFVATFAGDAFQHAGLADDFSTALWAMFSTNGGGSLFARTSGPNGNTDTLLGSGLLGGAHLFRIDWTASGVTYFVDGAQVASHTIAVTTPKLPMPPRSAQNSSGSLSPVTFRSTPSAVTTSSDTMWSAA